MHYLLTEFLIPSQRKVDKGNVEIDIVIPDLKTLEKNPRDALIIYFPKTSEVPVIKKKIDNLLIVQPIEENIWLIIKNKIDLDHKIFVNDEENENFSNIINEIKNFVLAKKQTKLKIHKI